MNQIYEAPKSTIGNRKSQISPLINPFTHPPIYFFIQNEPNYNTPSKLKGHPAMPDSTNNQSSIIDNQLKGPNSTTSPVQFASCPTSPNGPRVTRDESRLKMRNKPNLTKNGRKLSITKDLQKYLHPALLVSQNTYGPGDKKKRKTKPIPKFQESRIEYQESRIKIQKNAKQSQFNKKWT